MRVRAYGRMAACRRVGIVVLGGLLSQVSLAAPPAFTSGSVTVPIPTVPQQDAVVNLRQQQVITGSAPIQVFVESVFLNGVPTQALGVGGVNFSDTFGAICLGVFNASYTPAAGDVITLQVTLSNLQQESASATLTLVNGAAPTVDMQNPAQGALCDDPNNAPIARAGNDRTIADTDGQAGESVTLDATQSSDAEGDVLTYQWFAGGLRTPIATGAVATVNLPDGANTITLEVTDESGQIASDDVVITVSPTALPIANAGADRTIADTDRQAGESVTLDGTQSSDPDGTIVSYAWFHQTGPQTEDPLGNGPTLTVALPDGANTIRLQVTDNVGNVASDTAVITVGAAPVADVLEDIPNLTPNQQKMAQALDRICGRLSQLDRGQSALTADQRNLLQRCDGLLFNNTQENQVEALDELNGQDFAAARTQTLLFANTQYASVMDRLMALRGGARGLSLAGLNIVVDGKMVPLAQLKEMAEKLLAGGASADSADEPGGLLSDKWGLWARGNYSFGEKDRTAASPRFDANQWAIVGGIDYRLSDKAVLGAALSYGSSTLDFDPRSEGGLDTQSWAASLYGSAYAAKNFYFDGIVNVASSGYDADRNITYVDGMGLVNADAAGNTDGMTYSAGLSGGYDFLLGGLTLSPNLGVFYIDATIDGFTERGAGGMNLAYDEQKFKSLTANLGLRATYAWNLPWGVLLPHFRADYVREFEDDVDVFGVRFAADPDAASVPPILVETDNPDTSYWRLAAGFSAQFQGGISGYVEYQRLESFQFISFQDISIGLRFQRSF